MMKKFIYSFFAAVTLMFAASSCSQEEMIGGETSGNEVEVSFNLEMEGQTASRAIGDGLTVDEVIMGVFDESGTEIKNLRTTGTVDNLGAVVKVRLVKGQTYQFVFWAQKTPESGKNYYDLTNMKEIKVSYGTDANDENRDAFYAYEKPFKVNGSFSKKVTLKRPFAQLNLGTTAQDIEWAKNAGVTITHSKVTVNKVYNTLSTFDGKVLGEPVEVSYVKAAIPDAYEEELEIKDKENLFEIKSYEYLASDYLLVKEESELTSSIVYELYADTKLINTLTIENAPLQRNWRTNIVGEILTGEGTFNIVIDPIFDADRNYPMDGSNLDIWDGTATEPQLVDGVYIIDEASDLIGIAAKDAKEWNGATFELTKDLSFKNVENGTSDTTPAVIEPLFSEKNGAMNITFKGNDHVIRDFIINGENSKNSLFGGINGGTVSHLTIINAEVKGQATADGRAAIVVAQTFGSVKLESVIVKDSKLEGVQKIGGLIGFVHEGKVEVSDCTVEGLTLNSIELAGETGATGGLIGYINQGNNKITNSYVKSSTLNLIQSVNEAKRANGEFIGIIAGTSHTEITNCGVEGNIFNNSIEWTPFHNPLIGANRGDQATLTINGKAYPEVVPNYEDKGGYYEVYTAEGLLKWAYDVNKGQNTLGMHLMRDITLPAYTIVEDAENATYKFTETDITVDGDGKPSGSNWVPVGSKAPYYQGEIDGKNHSISGLRIVGTTAYQGFVGLMKTENGKMKNLKIKDATIHGSNVAVAAFVGNTNLGAFIENCHLIASRITGKDLVGGIVGYNQNQGNQKLTAVTNCSVDNSSTIKGLEKYHYILHGVGGIAGMNYGGIIKGCLNEAEIIGVESVGGIAGQTRCYDVNTSAYIINSHNSGNISGKKNLGGIAGYNLHDAGHTNSESIIIGCSSSASSILGDTNYKGLIIGFVNGSKIYSSWALSIDNISLTYHEGGNFVEQGIYHFSNESEVNSTTIEDMNNAIATYNNSKQDSDANYCSYIWSWTNGSWPVLVAQ